MKKLPMHNLPRLRAAFSIWESEGGGHTQWMQSQSAPHSDVPQPIDTEVEHFRIQMIAMKNLLITMLAHASERQLELGDQMAAFISARPGFIHHPRTVAAVTPTTHPVHRARYFQGLFEGGTAS